MAYSVYFNMDLAIDAVFDNATSSQRRTYKRWMRTEEFKSMTRDELKGVLDEKGYGEADIIDLLSKGMKMAKDKGDVTNFLRVVENLSSDNPGATEDDEIELHAFEVRHHLG